MCEYEQNNYLPPLCEALTKGGTCTIVIFYEMYFIFLEVTPTSFHSHSEMELSILRSKGHLILRMLQQKIGHDLLVQVQSINNSLMGTNCTCTVCQKEKINV